MLKNFNKSASYNYERCRILAKKLQLMKIITLFCATCFSVTLTAQTVLTNATIKAKIETVREGGDNESSEGMGRMMGGGETTITMNYMDKWSKVETRSSFINSIVINDNAAGNITNLTESQNGKTGYTANKEELLALRKVQDSTRKANMETMQAQGGGSTRIVQMNGNEKQVKIVYTEETKEINKIPCKKAVVTNENDKGEQSNITLWYTDAYALPEGSKFGGRMNFKDLKGLPISYETVRTISIGNNEMTITTIFEVTDIKNNAALTEKDFAAPKGYKILPYAQYIKENPSGGTQRFSVRM